MSTVNGRRIGLGICLLSCVLVFAVAYLFAQTVSAARSPASCWFAGGWLYATGLPTTYPYSITSEPYPTGTTQWSVDGTLAVPTFATSAYFWVRGHGTSLIKAGPQLNDYKVIAMCAA